MAKRRKPWERLFDTITVHRSPNSVYASPPTDAELNALEGQLGSRLPHTYREFMKRFGPGELLDWVELNPVSEQKKAGKWSVFRLTSEIRTFSSSDIDAANSRWLSSLVYFGSSYSGNFAWDLASVTSQRSRECKVYFLPRHEEDHPVVAGDSFWRFVEWADAYIQSAREEDSSEATAVGLRFDPLYIRRKKRPRKPDVKPWLDWNNDTALSLARTIREQARPDLFPILADALEDAGYDHADLLHFCRHGHPESDGVWVLDVLLGKA